MIVLLWDIQPLLLQVNDNDMNREQWTAIRQCGCLMYEL